MPDRSAVNKVGSAQLALAAHQLHKRVWVIADRLKVVRDENAREIELEAQPAAEVWPEAPDGIEISNIYFEIVPGALIDEIIHQAGDG